MNYFEHTIEIKEGEIFIRRNDKPVFCPLAVGKSLWSLCGSWCSLFNLEIYCGGYDSEGQSRKNLAGADVEICTGRIFTIENYKILEEK